MDKDEVLAALNKLRTVVSEQTKKLEDVKTRQAVLKAKADELTTKLSDALGTVDWKKARTLVDEMAEQATAAIERLAEALDGVDLDA